MGAWVVVVVAVGWATPLHTVGLSRGTYDLAPDGAAAGDVEIELQWALDDLRTLAPAATPAPTTPPGTALDPAGFVGVGADIVVTLDERPCPGGVTSARVVDLGGVAVTTRHRCGGAGAVVVDDRWLTRLPAGHRHLAQFGPAGSRRDALLHAGSTTVTWTTATPPSRAGFVLLGIEHILLGLDHLVFLFALVVVGGRARDLLAIVTAFTLAHSVTLALAVLGIVAASATWVEPVIALSIVAVGVENFFVADARGRWRVAGPFGLIHGFGFAGALAGIGLPEDDVPARLVAFNVGVELGQLAFLLVLLPPLALLRRRGWFGPRAVRGASLAVVAAGAGWFLQRVAG